MKITINIDAKEVIYKGNVCNFYEAGLYENSPPYRELSEEEDIIEHLCVQTEQFTRDQITFI